LDDFQGHKLALRKPSHPNQYSVDDVSKSTHIAAGEQHSVKEQQRYLIIRGGVVPLGIQIPKVALVEQREESMKVSKVLLDKVV
jgi:hypothetical protein